MHRIRNDTEAVKEIERYMPTPSSEWLLEEVGEQEKSPDGVVKRRQSRGGKSKAGKVKKTKRRKRS